MQELCKASMIITKDNQIHILGGFNGLYETTNHWKYKIEEIIPEYKNDISQSINLEYENDVLQSVKLDKKILEYENDMPQSVNDDPQSVKIENSKNNKLDNSIDLPK